MAELRDAVSVTVGVSHPTLLPSPAEGDGMLETGGPDDWRIALGRLHGVLSSLPVGLLAAVAVAEFVAFIQRDHGSRLVRTTLWIATTLAAIAAAVTGWLVSLDPAAGVGGPRHAVLGVALVATLAVVAALDVALPRRLRPLASAVRVGGLGATAALLVTASLLGLAMAGGPGSLGRGAPELVRPLLLAVEELAEMPAPQSGALATPESALPDSISDTAPATTPATTVVVLDGLDAATIDDVLRDPDLIEDLRATTPPPGPLTWSSLPIMSRVEIARLDDPAIDDRAARAILERTPAVRTVLLHGSAVSPALLPTLAELRSLERLTIWDTTLDTEELRTQLAAVQPWIRVIGRDPGP